MRLSGSDGQSLTLSIVGYQFPELTVAPYDSNWLRVEIDVSHPRGHWSASDPSLLTHEAARLADWLESVGAGAAEDAEESFIEPNLLFRVVEAPSGSVLRVFFGLELRPHWAESDVANSGDVFVEFPLRDLDLQQAARELREQLRRHPQRAAV